MYNASDTLSDCLESALASDYPNFEVLVVDDCSKDESVKIAREYPVKLIEMDENGGPAKARNAGAKAASGDIFLFTDSDILLGGDSLKKVWDTIREKDCDGVIGRLATRMRYPNFSSNYKNLYMHFTYGLLPDRVSVFYTSFASIKKKVFFDCDGFDTNYRGATIEDIEVGERITQKGYTLLINKEINVEHVRHYSLYSMFKTGFNRAAGITRIMLRKKFSPEEKSMYQTSPISFQAGIALSFITVFFFALGFFASIESLYNLAFLSYLMILVFNFPFLNFLRQEKNISFFLQSCGAIFVDMFAHGLGALYGVFTFVRGNRY